MISAAILLTQPFYYPLGMAMIATSIAQLLFIIKVILAIYIVLLAYEYARYQANLAVEVVSNTVETKYDDTVQFVSKTLKPVTNTKDKITTTTHNTLEQTKKILNKFKPF